MHRSNHGHRLIPPTAALLLALSLAAGQASAVEVELLGLGEAHNTVRVAILGAENFDPGTVTRKGLVLGWSKQGRDGGFVPAIRLRPARRDLNGDGYRDWIAVFRLSDPDFQVLQGGEVVQIELRGVYHDDVFGRAFVAQAAVATDGDPVSACTAVTSQQGALVGERCIWATAEGSGLKPIQVEALIDGLNQALVTASLEVADSSVVVIEAYGGKGHSGGNLGGTGCTAKGGSAGAAGYAQTVVTAGELGPNLYIYPAEATSHAGEGGASTVASLVDLTALSLTQLSATTAQELADVGTVIVLAGGGGGGGGGGGKGFVSDLAVNCHHGGDGGGGGSAIATTAAAVAGGGADGTGNNNGHGGNGTGGSGHPAGSAGIGGPGGLGYNAAQGQSTGGGPLWDGWTTDDNADYAPTAWTSGAGGSDDENAGSGGGGFGGGGSAHGNGDTHKGGGGGGGSFAMQATVDSAALDADLIYGPGAGSSQIVVTFQLVQSAQ